VVKQSTCELQATLPTKNTNNSDIDDLKEARFYVGTSPTSMPTSPSGVVQVPAPKPSAGQVVKWSCAYLPAGQYYFDVRVADTTGNASAIGQCAGGGAAPCPFVSTDDVPPAAATGLQAVGP
jgi:hypothetical protein